MTILSIDIGGSKIKAALLDDSGTQISVRERVETPRPAPPEAVLALIERLAAKLPGYERVSVGFPGALRNGIVRTAPNLGTPFWAGFNFAESLQRSLGKPARVLNDASVQGFGVISGKGLECVITLGTGMGFALFRNGHLAPHIELGQHIAFKDMTYDQYVGAAGLKDVGFAKWEKRVGRAVAQIHTVIGYDLLLIGGGNAKKLTAPFGNNVRIVDNSAGISGGAKLWADADPHWI